MKIMFTKESKYLLSVSFLFLFSFLCVPAVAQDISAILFGKDSKTDYIGQYNYNGKRKNGFGIERLKTELFMSVIFRKTKSADAVCSLRLKRASRM